MAQKISDLIKSFKKEDFFNTIDLHTHSTCSDGKCPPEELVKQAKTAGYKYLAICDHNTVEAYKNDFVANSDIIIPAVEFDSWHKGVLIHLLGYGIDTKNEELKKFYAKDKRGTEADIARFFSYRSPKKLISAIHSAGGIAVLAHPACCWCFSLDRFIKSLVNIGLDGVECYYPYRRHRGIIKFHMANSAEKIAEKYDLIKTGGSDNHETFAN